MNGWNGQEGSGLASLRLWAEMSEGLSGRGRGRGHRGNHVEGGRRKMGTGEERWKGGWMEEESRFVNVTRVGGGWRVVQWNDCGR